MPRVQFTPFLAGDSPAQPCHLRCTDRLSNNYGFPISNALIAMDFVALNAATLAS